MQRVRMFLGVAHVLAAVLLLPCVLLFGFFTTPVIVAGLLWLGAMGCLLLRPHGSVRTALRVTHMALAPLAVLMVAYGWFCLRAARRSAEAGGGLLGAFGMVPIVMGVIAGSLAAASLWASRSSAFMKRAGAGRGGGESRAEDGTLPGAPQS